MWDNAYATLPVKDYEAAKKFYTDVFGLELINESPGGAMYKTGSSKVLVYPSQYAGTNQATAASFDVGDLGQAVQELKNKGVTFEHYDGMPGMKLEGDIHVAEGMKAAWLKDPDGNILALTEMS